MHGKFNLREHQKKFAPTFRKDTDTWVGGMAFVDGTPAYDVRVAAEVLGASPYVDENSYPYSLISHNEMM